MNSAQLKQKSEYAFARLSQLLLIFSFLFVQNAFSSSNTAAMCKDLFESASELQPFIRGSFSPSTQSEPAVVRALYFNNKLVPKNSSINFKGQDYLVLDWGFDKNGEQIIRLSQSPETYIMDLPIRSLSARAFKIKQVRLEDLLAYQNDLVVLRTVRDHPNMTQLQVERSFLELKKWFFIKFRAEVEHPGFKAYMYNEIDMLDFVWHSFLLFTGPYASFGKDYFGYFIHHSPNMSLESATTWTKNPEPERRRQLFYEYVRETLGEETYQSWFVRKEFDPYKDPR